MMVRRARLAAPFALAALSVVAALSLGRVVDSSRFVLPVVGAALLPHALGALRRWRGWPVWVGAVFIVVGLAIYVVLARELSTTTAGIPGGATWRALQHQFSGGWHLLRTAPAPAPTTDGAILLAVIAVWCMAAFADVLAFTRQTALAAISPALVFFVWTSTLGTDDLQLALTAAFCVAAGAFVLAQNIALLDQRRSWLVSQHGARPHWLAPAAVLGGGAIVVALLVAPIVPGSGSDPLLDVAGNGKHGSGGHSYRPSIAPFIDINRKLDQSDDAELFTVKSSQPDYWRIAALDQYSSDSGGQWTLSAAGDGSVQVGLSHDAPAGTLQQDFSIGPLTERWLPAAYDPVAISLADTLVVESSGTIVADADSVSDLRYTVHSQLPKVVAGQPVSAQQIKATDASVPAEWQPYEALPSGADIDAIRVKAEQIVDRAGATTPYAKAEALRNYFRDPAVTAALGEQPFVYDTSVGYDDNSSAILQFLQAKRGYCVQFASAYAVMARALHIPARVAVGFTPGDVGADGRYHVTAHDAHAWPEIYLSGMGWTHLFDPTPSRDQTLSTGSNLPHDDAPVGTPVTTLPTRTTTPTTATGPGQSSGNGTAPPTGSAPPVPSVVPTGTSSSSSTGAWMPVLVVVALIILVLGGYVGAVVLLKRRRRQRRRDAADPAVAVTGAWIEALDRLHEADVVPRATQTPLDLAATVPAGTSAATARPMHELARAYGAARYGEGAVDDDDVRAAWSSLDQLERALDDEASWSRRWRRRLDASTLVRSVR